MELRRVLYIAAAGLAVATLGSAQVRAQASVQVQPPVAITTQSVNVRTAPDRSFPTVTWLLRGTAVTVVGCTEDWRWCDVTAGRDRGWIYTRYLAYTHDGSTASIMTGGPNPGLPMTPFSLATYWGEHYQGRLWVERQSYWQTRWGHRPPPRAWRAPRTTSP